MFKRAILQFVLAAYTPAWADDCRPTPPITLHNDEPFDLQVFFDQKPAGRIPLHLYAGGKLTRAVVTDRAGRARLGLLPIGEYHVMIPRKETLDVVVLPQRSGLNGVMISWFLFPKSRYKWVAGQHVPGTPCPMVVLKED